MLNLCFDSNGYYKIDKKVENSLKLPFTSTHPHRLILILSEAAGVA